MEVMYFSPIPEGRDPPAAVPIHWLGADDDWTEAPELGLLGKLFNQDVGNMQFVQRGLKATSKKYVQLADYNETKIRHFYDLYEQWMARP
jgi:hypothetical protein